MRATTIGTGHGAEPSAFPHSHRELLATATCAPADLGRLHRRWTSSCWLPDDTPLDVLLDGRYGSLSSAANAAEAVRVWFLGELPRMRRAGLSLTMDVRHRDAQVIMHADGRGSVVLPGWFGCNGPSDAARAISRLATQTCSTTGDLGTRSIVDPVVRAAHAHVCEEHLVRSISAVFPTSARTCASVRAHQANRDAFERATAESILWLSRIVIVSESIQPTAEHLAWFREACNVNWTDARIVELWQSFADLATQINGATLSSYLLHRAGGHSGEALAMVDHLASRTDDPDAFPAAIREAAAWARMRRQDSSACA